jgi:hypothetical protein
MLKTGMSHTCVSIRSKQFKKERCLNKTLADSEWCGKHKSTQQRFVVQECRTLPERIHAAKIISSTWRRWIARRSGPLLHFRTLSNNPYDFFSSDPIEEIPLKYFISFVDAGKGYCMDIKSASSLIIHATANKETPLNPFNRAPLSTIFLRRVIRHRGKETWQGLEAETETQRYAMATTDIFNCLNDLGNYTNPQWLIDLSTIQMQQFYIELADIWFHRATLSLDDRLRIVPSPAKVFTYPVTTVLIMKNRALRPLIIETCKNMVSSALSRSDRQLGGMYVLGSLALVSPDAGTAFPWLLEMFSPGVTRIVNGHLTVAHPSVLAY